MILNSNVAGKSSGIGHNNVASYNAVMGYVAVSHKKIIVPNDGDPVPPPRSSVKSDKFPEDIIAADFQMSGFAFVFEILRISPDRTVTVEMASFSNICPAVHIYMRIQNAAGTYLSVRADDTVGPYPGIRRDLAGFVYDSCRMYRHWAKNRPEFAKSDGIGTGFGFKVSAVYKRTGQLGLHGHAAVHRCLAPHFVIPVALLQD
jgi:hypothetical protein